LKMDEETLEEKEVRLAKWEVELQERKIELDERTNKLNEHEGEWQKTKNDLFGLVTELEKRKFDEFQALVADQKNKKKKKLKKSTSDSHNNSMNTSMNSLNTSMNTSLNSSQDLNSPIEEGVITKQDQKFIEDIQRLLERHDFDVSKLRSKSVKGLEEDKLKRYWKLKGFKEYFPSTDLKKGWKTTTLERIIDNLSPWKMKEIIGKNKHDGVWLYHVSWVFKHKPEVDAGEPSWENPDELTDEYLEEFNRLLASFNTEK